MDVFEEGKEGRKEEWMDGWMGWMDDLAFSVRFRNMRSDSHSFTLYT